MYYQIKNKCRLCGDRNLKTVINLGYQYIQHAFIHPKKINPLYRKFPTVLVRCTNPKCGLVQLKHTINRDILYSVYWYRSGTNNTMKAHLRGIVQESMKVTSERTPKILDIGCNDGTMLQLFPSTCQKTGIDPSDISFGLSKGINFIHDFFPSKKLIGRSFDIVTTIAMYYDVDNPVHFAREVRKILSKNGIWIVEVAYLPTMLQNVSYDTICHEHLSYFHLGALENIARMAHLKIIKADLNSINGGSIRVYLTHESSHFYKNIPSALEKIRHSETKMKLDSPVIYNSFKIKTNNTAKSLLKLLISLKKNKTKIHVYGASTKGNTILQYSKINSSLIDFCADKNHEKWGAKTPGSKIPIISENESRNMNPDYYLVLPWSFRSEFLKREKKLLKKGTKMIFPLPKLETVFSH